MANTPAAPDPRRQARRLHRREVWAVVRTRAFHGAVLAYALVLSGVAALVSLFWAGVWSLLGWAIVAAVSFQIHLQTGLRTAKAGPADSAR